MAWRNVWRNRRRSLTTISAMSFALLMMLLLSGLFEGMLLTMERDIVELEVGDIQIFAGDYRVNPSIFTRIQEPEEILGPSFDRASGCNWRRTSIAWLTKYGVT